MLFVSLTKQHLNFASWGPGVHFWQQCPAQSRSRARQLLCERRCGTGTRMEQGCSELMCAKKALLNLLSHPSHTFLMVVKSFRMNPAPPASPFPLDAVLSHSPSLSSPFPSPFPSSSSSSSSHPSTHQFSCQPGWAQHWWQHFIPPNTQRMFYHAFAACYKW